MRLLRNLCMALLVSLGGIHMASAEDLAISGLGRIPLGDKVTVTDGSRSVIRDGFVKMSHAKDYGKTAEAAVWSMLTVPPGMNLYPEKAPYPYDSLQMYQLKKENVQGIFTASVFVYSGSEDDFFHEGNKKAEKFWNYAFHKNIERPTSLFGMPKIRVEEFQDMLDEAVKEKKGKTQKVRILTFSPWRAFRNNDGTYRWAQESKVIFTNEKGLSFPMWIYATLYKAHYRYYLIVVNGSHTAEDELGDTLLYGFYGLERKKS